MNNKNMRQVLLCLLLVIITSILFYNICKYPEKYFTTWRYQLQNDIQAGDAEAIAYYNNNYIANGIYLYGEDKDVINLSAVTDYKSVNDELYIYTTDGNYYNISK